MAAVRHLGFVGRVLGPSTMTIWWFLLVVQNLVEIDAVFSIIYNFQYFAVWLENAYSRPQSLGFGGTSPQKWGAISMKPPKGTPLRESASFEPSSVKIHRRVRPVGEFLKKV